MLKTIRVLMISFRADQSGRVQRVNDNKKVCKWACCCRGVIYNNERGAGGCGVESLMEISGGWAAREERNGGDLLLFVF